MGEGIGVGLPRSRTGRTGAADLVAPRLAEEFAAAFAPHVGPGDDAAPLGIHRCRSPAIALAVSCQGLSPLTAGPDVAVRRVRPGADPVRRA